MTGKVNFMEILFLSISMVCTAVLISCGTAAEKKPEEETAVTVRTEVLVRSSMHTYIETDGSVETENSVKKGDILAYIDPSTPGTKYELSRVTAPITGSIITKENANIVENIIKKNLAASYIIPSGVTVSYEGSWKTMAKQGNVFLQIVILAILLVFGVMAGTYGSFKAPFINMMTIPFMLTGVIISYVLMRQPVSIMTMVGLVMLVGIVVNNGIILVDYTNLLINRGYKMKDACLEAGTSRLRPVLMTTLTTILGMLPMSFTTAGSAALVQPIGLCVVGGLTSSTFVTLFFIPVLYSLVMKEKKTEKSSIAIDGTGSGKELNVADNEKMAYRCEIIANQSVEDDLIGLLEEQVRGIQYTLNEGVYGRGTRNRKLGTTIWPELNFALYTYVRSEALESVQQVVEAVQKKFPDEGVQLFVLPVNM